MATAIAKSTGCKSSYSLMRLPGHNRTIQCFPDAMHTVKDCIERIFFLLIGKVNLDKITKCEKTLHRFGFKESSRKRKRGKEALSDRDEHPYILSSSELKLADNRSKSIIMTNSDFCPGSIFFRTTGLKSHDWKEVCLCLTNACLSYLMSVFLI